MSKRYKTLLNVRRQFVGKPEDDLRIRAEVRYYGKGFYSGVERSPCVGIETSIRLGTDGGPCLGDDIYKLDEPSGKKRLKAEIAKFRKFADTFDKVADALEIAAKMAANSTEGE